jgi:hypothetical protein
MKSNPLLVGFFGLLLAGTAVGQEKQFEWQPANDESVRLDPANYHAGRVYHPGPNGGGMHIDVDSAQPLTIAMARQGEWAEAMQRPELLYSLNYLCRQEHVIKATYTCQLPPEPMVLIVHDERYSGTTSVDHAVFAGLGAVLDPSNRVDRAIGGIATALAGEGATTRHFVSPNDVHIQYYSWVCVANCNPPEFRWIQQFKEKYELTSFTKVYGGLRPEHDGEKVSVKIKSPMPMAVAILPSQVANQLHSSPDALEAALRQNSCQQRGVQSLTFECAFNVADGPQSLVVVPEAGQNVPHHKKAEIEVYSAKCVENCAIAANN